jgi:hypothetical protein
LADDRCRAESGRKDQFHWFLPEDWILQPRSERGQNSTRLRSRARTWSKLSDRAESSKNIFIFLDCLKIKHDSLILCHPEMTNTRSVKKLAAGRG